MKIFKPEYTSDLQKIRYEEFCKEIAILSVEHKVVADKLEQKFKTNDGELIELDKKLAILQSSLDNSYQVFTKSLCTRQITENGNYWLRFLLSIRQSAQSKSANIPSYTSFLDGDFTVIFII